MTTRELEDQIQQCDPWDNDQLLELIQALAQNLAVLEAQNESLSKALAALLRSE